MINKWKSKFPIKLIQMALQLHLVLKFGAKNSEEWILGVYFTTCWWNFHFFLSIIGSKFTFLLQVIYFWYIFLILKHFYIMVVIIKKKFLRVKLLRFLFDNLLAIKYAHLFVWHQFYVKYRHQYYPANDYWNWNWN